VSRWQREVNRPSTHFLSKSRLPSGQERGNGKITKVESLTKQDKLVAYEAQVDKNGKRSEIQVGPKGERLLTEV
jgi:hypothetical protein